MNLLLHYPYIFYVAFPIINLLPLNHGGGGRLIATRKLWRTVLYLSGILMGCCYSASGILAVVTQPFAECTGGEKDYLMWGIYTTFLPVGLIMGGFHIVFMKQRMGPKEGEGTALADAPTLICCVMGQSVFLAIWYAWLSNVRESCGGFGVAPFTIGLSCAGSFIIVSIICFRLVMYVQSGFDSEKFAEAYTGAGFSCPYQALAGAQK